MTYRLSTQEDISKINALCEKYQVAKPSIGLCFVAEENGEIVGFVNGGQIGLIETIVSESATCGNVLFAMLEGALLVNTGSSVLAEVVNPIVGNMLERFGYTKLEGQSFYIKKR